MKYFRLFLCICLCCCCFLMAGCRHRTIPLVLEDLRQPNGAYSWMGLEYGMTIEEVEKQLDAELSEMRPRGGSLLDEKNGPGDDMPAEFDYRHDYHYYYIALAPVNNGQLLTLSWQNMEGTVFFGFQQGGLTNIIISFSSHADYYDSRFHYGEVGMPEKAYKTLLPELIRLYGLSSYHRQYTDTDIINENGSQYRGEYHIWQSDYWRDNRVNFMTIEWMNMESEHDTVELDLYMSKMTADQIRAIWEEKEEPRDD